MAKEQVFKATLDATPIVQSLEKIKKKMDEVRAALGKTLTVKFEAKQFSTLISTLDQGFTKLDTRLASMSTKAQQNVNKTATSLKTLSSVASNVGTDIGNELGKGIDTGVKRTNDGAKTMASALKRAAKDIKSDGTVLDNQIDAAIARYRAKFAALDKEGQRAWMRQSKTLGVNPFDPKDRSGFILNTSDAKGNPQQKFNAHYQQVVDLMFKNVEQQSRNNNNVRNIGKNLGDRYARLIARLGDDAGLDDKRIHIFNRKKAVAIPKTADAFVRRSKDGNLDVDTDAAEIAMRAIKERLQERARQEKEAVADGKKQDRERDQIAAQLRILRDQLRQQTSKMSPESVDAFYAANPQFSRTGAGYLQTNAATGKQSVDHDQVFAHKTALDGAKRVDVAQQKLLRNQNALNGLQKVFNSGLADTVLRIGKWLIMYRAISVIMNQISRGLRNVVMTGLEYSKQQELQQLGLKALLAESFKVVDSQQHAVEGLAKYNALQALSVQQWRQLQQSSLSVVGTTQDLMLIYNSILPFTTRLGKNLDDVQAMTRAAAVAAGVLNISFQDARSAMISMLQGRTLTRNRLVGVLGFEKGELEKLKGTPELFDKIMSRMGAFNDLAGEASQTFGALRESLEEFTGIVGSKILEPVVAGFKKFVGSVQSLLFNKSSTGGFVLKSQVESLLSAIRTGIDEAMDPLREFFDEMNDGEQSAYSLAIGMGKLAKMYVQVAVAVGKALVAVVDFIAKNGTLLKVLGYSAVIGTAIGMVLKLTFALHTLSGVTSGVGGVFGHLVRTVLPGFGRQLDKTTQEALALQRGTSLLRTGLAQIGSTILVGGILTALGYLVTRWFQVRDAAKQAQKAQEDAINKRFARANMGIMAGFESDERTEQLGAARAFGTNVDNLGNQIHSGLGVDNVIPELRDISKTINAIGAEYQKRVDAENALTTQISKLQKLQDGRTEKERELHESDIQALIDQREKERKVISSLETAHVRFTQRQKLIHDNIDIRGAELEAQTQAAKNFLNSKKFDPSMWERISRFGLSIGVNTQDSLQAKEGDFEAAKRDVQAVIDAAEEHLKNLEKLRVLRDRFVQENSTAIPEDGTDLETPEKPGEFSTTYDELVKQIRRKADILVAEQNQRAAEQRLTQEANAAAILEIEQNAATEIIAAWKAEADYFEKVWLPKRQAMKSKMTPDEIANWYAGNKDRQQSAQDDVTLLGIRNKTDQANLTNQMADRLVEWKRAIDQIEADTYDRVADEAKLRVIDTINDMKKQLVAVGALSPMGLLIMAQISRLQAMLPAIGEKADIASSLKKIQSTMALVDAQEQALHNRFNAGSISVSAYVHGLERLNEVKQDLLEQEKKQLLAKRDMTESPEELEQIEVRIVSINDEMATLADTTTRIVRAFDGWMGTLDSIANMGNMFKGFNDGLTAMISNLRRAGQFMDVLKKAKEAVALTAFAAKGNAQDGKTGLLGNFLNLAGTIGGGNKQSAKIIGSGPGGVPMILPGMKGATGMQQALGSIAIAGAAASVAIGFASAMYAKAVEKAKKNMSDGLEGISKMLRKESISVAEAAELIERRRKEAQARYGGSKSGKAALKEMMPEFDEQMDQLQEQMKATRKSFTDRLNEVRAGNGPFADFYKQLLELQVFTKGYLDTFIEGTAEHAEALEDITELMNLTLIGAKRQLEEQMAGFNQEAIDSALRVFDLVEEQIGLYEQLTDNAERRKELEEEVAEFTKEQQEAFKELNDSREEHLKKILALEREIADTVRQAVLDEEEIRRRGVLEAQEIDAVVKAREISKVRRDARDNVSSLRDRIKEERDSFNFEDKLEDFNKKYAGKLKDFAKELEQLAKSEKKINEQLAITAVRLDTARQIAAIEGAMFDTAGDRLDLERQRSILEIQSADRKVKQWQEVAKLIDSIIETGGDVLFQPPPGFPVINIQIGNITIDNSLTTTGGGVPQGPGGNPDPGDYGPPELPGLPDGTPPAMLTYSYGVGKTAGRQGLT